MLAIAEDMAVTKKKSQSSSKAKALSGELRAVADEVLSSVPGSAVSWKFHHASFDVGGKVFAFTRPGGMAMKLSEARIGQLIGSNGAANLVMGKRTMREWVVVPANGTAQLLPLLKEAAAFVSSISRRK
jgi:hypothetical protein